MSAHVPRPRLSRGSQMVGLTGVGLMLIISFVALEFGFSKEPPTGSPGVIFYCGVGLATTFCAYFGIQVSCFFVHLNRWNKRNDR